MSGPLDSENKPRIYNPYLSGLFSEWFKCVLGNGNGKVKSEVAFVLVDTLYSVR